MKDFSPYGRKERLRRNLSVKVKDDAEDEIDQPKDSKIMSTIGAAKGKKAYIHSTL